MPQVYMASGSMAIGARKVGLLPSAPRLCSWITECLSIVSVMDQSVEGVLTAIHWVRDAAVSGLLGGFAEVDNMVFVHGDKVEG